MPKQSAKAEFNSFIKGLITEAGPLNFPENASLDEENFELNRRGSRNRRLGMDFEDSYVEQALLTTFDNVIANPPSTFKWMNAGGDSTKNLLVVQTGAVLSIFDMSIEPLSNQTPAIVLPTYFSPTTKYSFAAIDGKLVVTAGTDLVGVIVPAGGAYVLEYVRILTRDVWGIEVTDIPDYETDVSFRSAIDSDFHRYNLKNQSWGIPRKDSGGVLMDPVEIYKGTTTVSPSNSEAVWAGLQFQAGATPFERVYPNLFEEVIGAKISTARGYFIIDALRRGQSRNDEYQNNLVKYPALVPLSGTIPSDYTPGGASLVGEFAGRAFFAGFDGEVVDGDARSPNLANYIFFSQLVKSKQDIIKCYQEGDPTSRESSDLVDTDGGFIRIAGMDKPLALVSMGTHLIVIATNGVWGIQGGSDYGFSATNYKVARISTFGGISRSSVVEFSGKIAYWGNEGIFAIGKNQYGDIEVQSISETTIQTYYDAISKTSKRDTVGTYDPVTKKLRWVHRSGEQYASTSVQMELTFDLTTGAFSKNRIYNHHQNKIEIVSIFSSVDFKQDSGVDLVLSGANPVLVGTDPVGIPQLIASGALQATRYLTVVLDDTLPFYTFSYYRDTGFLDWDSYDASGTDAQAFLVTGAITGGDSSIAKQVPYITMQFYRTEDGVDADLVPVNQSSCMVRGQWDWANSINSNKWGPLWEAYRYRRAYLAVDVDDPYDTGFELITSKTKLRGRGKAFSLYLQTSPGKDCQIVGWNLNINGNQFA